MHVFDFDCAFILLRSWFDSKFILCVSIDFSSFFVAHFDDCKFEILIFYLFLPFLIIRLFKKIVHFYNFF